MTYTRDTMPAVPDGQVMLANCGTYPRELDMESTEAARAIAAVRGYPVAVLAYETRGYTLAGSCMRWQEAQWSVLFWLQDGTRHGQRFLPDNETGARAYFAKLTDPQKVSAMRQHDAMMEDTVYRPAREAKARAAADLDARAAATTLKSAIALAHSLEVPVYRRDKSKREILARIDVYTRQSVAA
jgi:hypothetical protein